MERYPEVPPGHIAEPGDELDGERLVEPQGVAKVGNGLAGGVRSEHDDSGIAGDEVDQQEDDERHQHQGGHKVHDPVKQVSQHELSETFRSAHLSSQTPQNLSVVVGCGLNPFT